MHKVEVILRVGRWGVESETEGGRGESEAEGEGGLESEAEGGGGVVRQRRGGWRVRQRGVGSGAKEGVESESGGLRVR